TDSTTSSATGSTGLALYDWLVAFDEPITSDTTAPTVSSITSTTASGTYTPGNTINITVTFSEAVTTTGTVTVNLNSGGSCTITASSSTTASCTYTVLSGQTANPLTVSSISGTVQDASSNTMTNSTPVTNLSASKTIVIAAHGGGGNSGSKGRKPLSLVPTPVPAALIPAVTAPDTPHRLTCSSLDESLTLRVGSSQTAQIATLQSFLKSTVAPWLRVSGVFGPYTTLAVNKFQLRYPNETYRLANRKAPTGIAGYYTLRLINSFLCS
ncbi:MAG TPA: hypothetical protein VLB02_01365, partial [Candidatus Paceibacterota bacterium]|nr:hypothetical protein [Candidatus Paceibacterota bacterium]